MGKSEVALLRWQIEREVEAMRLAMSGLAIGTARHDFINARMDRIGTYQEQLTEHVGEQEASKIVCTVYVETMDKA